MTTTTAKEPEVRFTAEDLVRLRDTDQLSWGKVAQALGFASSTSARRAYRANVRPPAESVLSGRSGRAARPLDLTGANLETVRDAIAGRTLVVTRKNGTEEITVARVTSIKDDTVNFNDGSKARSVKLAAITAAK